jgi:enterochelin esterase-like enzyme/sugar lactone lactonase YvrE
MVFQDGEGFIKEDGRERVPIVFDNLIAKHEMPVTIGIFINPGVLKASSPDQQDRFNRSFEYDGMGDRYARFLLEEIIPEVAKHYNLSTNPDDRAIAGLSSGGICAFTVAWNRPDAFHRVLSFIGSFTDLRGGDVYPNLIRKTEPKPLRVFLQDGIHDLNIYAGDWWMANQTMASALAYSGYDVKFVTGDKDHDMDQGGAILPDALRWLWRDYPQPIAKPAPNHNGDKRTAILDPASDWEEVKLPKSPHPATVIDDRFNAFSTWDLGWIGDARLTSDSSGDVFVSDLAGQRILEVAAEGSVSTFTSFANGNAQSPYSLAFGPDGSLYSCQSGHITAYGQHGRGRVVERGIECQDLAVGRGGVVFFTDPAGYSLWRIDARGNKIREDLPFPVLVRPNGISFSADHLLLLVDDPTTRWVSSFQLQSDGSLRNVEPFYRLEARDDSTATGASAMAVDTLGYLYVVTRLGIQVCDQPGRVVAIINPPPLAGQVQGLAFGGRDFQDLYALVGGKLYARHLLRKGVMPGNPVKPPAPQL